MTELEWWTAAAKIFAQEREHLDKLLEVDEPTTELREAVLMRIRRTLQRLEALDKPFIQ